jgi:pseudouridine-5'-phosphate glycosidase
MEQIPNLVIHPEITQAIHENQPVVALESAVITHGLPNPQNGEIALHLQKIIRSLGAVPATIAMIEGKVRIGLNDSEILFLANNTDVHKISARDIACGIQKKWSGGTTVAGTLLVARMMKIRVFATGGIGGVHRGNPNDVSADLDLLALSPVMVVSSGAKAILDLPATLEYLETLSIPVIGFRTAEFPAFYTRRSGLPLNCQADSADEIAEIANIHWGLKEKSALLIANPPPIEIDIGFEKIQIMIYKAIKEAEKSDIRGSALTPFLLGKLNELTSGSSLKTNLALLQSNAELAAKIATAWSKFFESK